MIAIAAGTELHERIDTALATQGLSVHFRAGTAADLCEQREQPADDAVIVFVCEVDAPREMASLRRLCREAPDSPVVIVSSPTSGVGVRRALDGGARGVVFDSELERTLATTVLAVAIGQSVVPGKLRAGVERPALSHREHQVLALVRKGLTNAEIAERLYLAESTIKSHLASIFAKLGVRSRKEVATALDDLDRGPLPRDSFPEAAGRAPA
ncbi:MAG TPA: response regulator transcription factor [Solirubrobacterales bacterium]|nr:response regulator transcription factor [Solirubrobacterales bacterium]